MRDDRPLQSTDDYRHALAEIRRLRGDPAGAERDRRLTALEAATADYAERLRGADLEAGRPTRSPPPGSAARTQDAPVEEPSAEDPAPPAERRTPPGKPKAD